MSEITPAARQHLQRAWSSVGLPETDFRHWSLEFARDIYEIIGMYQQPWMKEACAVRGIDPADELLVVLEENGVFEDDDQAQQWVPAGQKEQWKW